MPNDLERKISTYIKAKMGIHVPWISVLLPSLTVENITLYVEFNHRICADGLQSIRQIAGYACRDFLRYFAFITYRNYKMIT